MFKDKLNKIVASIANEEPVQNVQPAPQVAPQQVPSSFVPIAEEN